MDFANKSEIFFFKYIGGGFLFGSSVRAPSSGCSGGALRGRLFLPSLLPSLPAPVVGAPSPPAPPPRLGVSVSAR